jgi:hypothetical protein
MEIGAMKIVIKESPKEIEKDFNQIKLRINNYILKKESQVPPSMLFKQLDDEFEKVKKKYEKQNDQINLLHVEHNYLWSKLFQCLHDDPTQSLSLIIKAILKLFERNGLRPYSSSSLEKMLGTYKVALIKISEKGELINFNDIEEEFINFVKMLTSSISVSSEKFESIISALVRLFIENQYVNRIEDLKIQYSNFNEYEALANKIKTTLGVIEKTPLKTSYQPSLCYEALYKLRKKQLHFLVRFLFFEKSEEKTRNTQEIIKQITREMVICFIKSLRGAKKFIRNLPLKKQNDEKIKIMITLKEIDKLTAKYYREAHSNKNILKAWTFLDKIKQFLVIKAFKENVPLSDALLRYYGEEWTLLYIFTKICLLKEEIIKRTQSVSQDWEKDMFAEITKSLEIAEKLFKYEMIDKKDYTLKIMTSTFAGSFSEYFIHELCREFFDYGIIDEETPLEFKDLLESIKLARNKEDIKLNDVLEQDKPDIDVHIENKCAIFLKNSKIESDEMKKIWEEMKLCRKKGINKVFYGINFIKNIEKIEYIRRSFEKIKLNYSNLDIKVFDIKDLVSVFLYELKKSGKSKLNFSQLNLYRVLDY